jgi:hypothetical protein
MNILGDIVFNEKVQSPQARSLPQQQARFGRPPPLPPPSGIQLIENLRSRKQLNLVNFKQIIDSLSNKHVKMFVMQILQNNTNKNVNKLVYDSKINITNLRDMNSSVLRKLLVSQKFVTAYTSTEEETLDNFAIAHGGWSQRGWSTVSESRVFLCKTSNPIKYSDAGLYTNNYGSDCFGQNKNSLGEQTYSEYVNIPIVVFGNTNPTVPMTSVDKLDISPVTLPISGNEIPYVPVPVNPVPVNPTPIVVAPDVPPVVSAPPASVICPKTTIQFDMNLKYSRPGIVSSIYLVPLGLNWNTTDYKSYAKYKTMSFNIITEGDSTASPPANGWYFNKPTDTEKLSLIQKLAPEYGMGYNDVNGQGQGYSHQINIVDATLTGLQVTLHGAFTKLFEGEYYITNENNSFITNNGEKILLDSITSSTDANFAKIKWDVAGTYCNIHGPNGYSNSNSFCEVIKKIGVNPEIDITSAPDTELTEEQLTTYGPGSKFAINTLEKFNVECCMEYNTTTESITMIVTVSQTLNSSTNLVRITVRSGGFSKRLGLANMNLVNSYWSYSPNIDQVTNINQYKASVPWWVDGFDTETDIIQPIRGVTAVPVVKDINSQSTLVDTVLGSDPANTSVFRNYNLHAVPVSYYKQYPGVTDSNSEESFMQSGVSRYPPSICLFSNLKIVNDQLIKVTEKDLCGWKMDIMYTGLRDNYDSRNIAFPVHTYWAGRHNGSFQMSYTNSNYNINDANKTYICDVNATELTRYNCAQANAKYAINRCTVSGAEWIPTWSTYDDNTNFQYDFSNDILKMGEIRKKECINTNNLEGVNNYNTDNYEKQAKDGLHIFEATGVSINGKKFTYP